MLLSILLASVVAVNSCPTVQPSFCPVSATIEAHNTITYHPGTEPWPCDGTVWWEFALDDTDVVRLECSTRTAPTGDVIISCPTAIAPVKYWDREPMQSAWLTFKACNEVGCSSGCVLEVIWPEYTCYNGAC